MVPTFVVDSKRLWRNAIKELVRKKVVGAPGWENGNIGSLETYLRRVGGFFIIRPNFGLVVEQGIISLSKCIFHYSK